MMQKLHLASNVELVREGIFVVTGTTYDASADHAVLDEFLLRRSIVLPASRLSPPFCCILAVDSSWKNGTAML
jgi:hypothetical protein